MRLPQRHKESVSTHNAARQPKPLCGLAAISIHTQGCTVKVSIHSSKTGSTYLLGVLKVLEESVLGPGDTLVQVSSGVAETLGLTGLAAKDTVQVGTDCGVRKLLEAQLTLVGATSLSGVALSATSLEQVSTLLSVAFRETHGDECKEGIWTSPTRGSR